MGGAAGAAGAAEFAYDSVLIDISQFLDKLDSKQFVAVVKTAVLASQRANSRGLPSPLLSTVPAWRSTWKIRAGGPVV